MQEVFDLFLFSHVMCPLRTCALVHSMKLLEMQFNFKFEDFQIKNI